MLENTIKDLSPIIPLILINKKVVIKHFALIPDGNRRYSTKCGIPLSEGYARATASSCSIVEYWVYRTSIPYFSVYGLSIDNLKRNLSEVQAVLVSLIKGLTILYETYRDTLKMHVIGSYAELADPKLMRIIHTINTANTTTDTDTAGTLKIDAVKQAQIYICPDWNNVQSPVTVPVDFLIRTGGEKRLSGFMPEHTGYAELYFSDNFFPDFSVNNLQLAFLEYEERQRRFGT